MKILSLTAPYGTLMALGLKLIETRSWKCSYRGELAIHQAKGVGPVGGKRGFLELCLSEPFQTVLTEHMRSLNVQTLEAYLAEIPFGGIVCVVNLVQCLSTNDDNTFAVLAVPGYEKPCEDDNEYAFGNYDPNRWMWFTENLRRLKEPVACRGAQGLRDLPPDIETLVREQI